MRTIGNGTIERIRGGSIATATGNANIVSDWRLVTNDTAAAVEAANYFDDMAAHLNVGDHIYASLDLDGTPKGKAYMVTAIAAGVVTIAELEVTHPE